MKKPKNARLVWGIILAGIGIIGFGGVGGNSNPGGYIAMCLILTLIGVLLIVFYARAVKKYKAALMSDYEAKQRAKREAEDRLRRSQQAEEERLRQEEDLLRREAERRKQEADALRICPHCGGASKGTVCEYCGSKF